MILDKELEFADGTWAPTATGDNIAPNVLDTAPLGGFPSANAGRELGEGEPEVLLVTVKTTATSGGSATVDFRVRSDSASNLTTAPVDHGGTGPIAVASLVAGAQFKVKLPIAASGTTYKRYVGCNANIGTAVLTAGAFQVDIVRDVQNNVKYAGGFGIS